MKYFLTLVLVFLLLNSSHSQSGSDSPFQASVLTVELGYDGIQDGYLSIGIRKFNWKDISFAGTSFHYGFNPWDKLHSLKLQFDYSWYFPSLGVSFQSITDGDAYNVSFRPQVGVFFVYGNLYFGPNVWFNNNFDNLRNGWSFTINGSLPVKRWK